MKYNIFEFSQEVALTFKRDAEVITNGKKSIKTSRLDVTDLLILQVVADFMNRKSIIKQIIDDKIYFWISYKCILDDLPILDIKKQAFTDRLNKLVLFELLEKSIVKNEQGSFSFYRIGDKYESLKYKKDECYSKCKKIDKIVPHNKKNSEHIPYRTQLLDKKWKLLSRKIKKRDGFKCAICGSDVNLQVHHKKYKKGLMAWEYSDSDLITLCGKCHKKIHNIK